MGPRPGSVDTMTLWTYRARATDVIDGDTIEVVIDHGMHMLSTQRIRIASIDAPEMFSGDNREAGITARFAVAGWINEANRWDPQWPLLVETAKDRMSFNRYVGIVSRIGDSEVLADYLVNNGFAVWSER